MDEDERVKKNVRRLGRRRKEGWFVAEKWWKWGVEEVEKGHVLVVIAMAKNWEMTDKNVAFSRYCYSLLIKWSVTVNFP